MAGRCSLCRAYHDERVVDGSGIIVADVITVCLVGFTEVVYINVLGFNLTQFGRLVVNGVFYYFLLPFVLYKASAACF